MTFMPRGNAFKCLWCHENALVKNYRNKQCEKWLTRDGFGASHTLLCIQVAETLQTVGEIFPGGETMPWKLFSAADAEKALTMPRLILIGHTPRCDGLKKKEIHSRKRKTNSNYFVHWAAVSEIIALVNSKNTQFYFYLFTSTALVCKLFFKAGHTKVARVFGDERLGSYWLLAAVTQEASLMPAVPLVLHFSGTWQMRREQLSQHMVP